MGEALDLDLLPEPAGGADVLVLRSDADADAETVHRMATAILDHYESRGFHPLLVHLRPGESLDLLDEEQMRASGWVRS